MASDIYNLLVTFNPSESVNFASIHKAVDRMVGSGLLNAFHARDVTGRERQHVVLNAKGKEAAQAALFSLHNILGSELFDEWRVEWNGVQTTSPALEAMQPEPAQGHVSS